jgi:hypothetical protein
MGPSKGDSQWTQYRRDGDPRLDDSDRGGWKCKGSRVKSTSTNGNGNGSDATRQPPIDWEARTRELAGHLTAERSRELAKVLGLPECCLKAIRLLGFDPNQGCWTFPERDGAGAIVGINRRFKNGDKKAMAGGSRGLTIVADWDKRDGPIFLPEGASGTLAFTALGLAAIGRPNNRGGIDALAELLAPTAKDRPIVIVGDFDPKPNGDWPGRDGAEETARGLADRLGRSVGLTMPPAINRREAYKDTRDWVLAQKLDPTVADAWQDAGLLLVDKLLARIKSIEPGKQVATAVLPIVPCGQFVATYPDLRPPLIEGLLRRGETMNIIAAPKVGKSWLTLSLAFAVAQGYPWMGFRTTQGNVLLIDNELHPETIAYRVRKMATCLNVPLAAVNDKISIQSVRGRLQDLHQLGAGLLKIGSGHFSLCILDSFYRTMPFGTNENDNGTMAALYNELDHLADMLHASFALIHHATKGDQSAKSITDVGAGAGAQSRATDTHLILRPHEQPGVVVLEAAVRSWPPVEPRCLRWNWPVWLAVQDADPTLLRGAKRLAANKSAASVEADGEQVMDALEREDPDSRGISYTKLRDACRFGKPRIDRAIELLVDAGRIEESPGTVASGNNAKREAFMIRKRIVEHDAEPANLLDGIPS